MENFGGLEDVVKLKVKIGDKLSNNNLNINHFKEDILRILGEERSKDTQYFKDLIRDTKIRVSQRKEMWDNIQDYKVIVLDNIFRSNNTLDLVELLYELIEIERYENK